MYGKFKPVLWLFLGLALSSSLEAQTTRISLVPYLSGLSQPVLLTNAKDGSNRVFIVEQVGRIRVVQPGAATPTVFLDISARVLAGGEQGLLGLAFHPQFASNRRFYVNYTRRPDGATVVSEFLDNAERVLFTVPQPYANHNGGMVEFGPDGYLYIGMGDGGSGNDPQNHAQNPNDLLGKMLRINVNAPNSPPEIYASGLRNPWRFSFDRLTGTLYAGDVGQNAREEIDVIVRGGNYGWRVFEGTRCTGLGPASCSTPGFIPPIAEYENGPNGGCSVTGGYVYRGTQGSLPYGAYVYADFCTGEIFMFNDGVPSRLLDSPHQISSFGEDEAGEVYVVDLQGSILRITNPDAVSASDRPFTITNANTFVASTAGSASALTVGYGRIQADVGLALPAGLAIFSFQQRGVLVTEASVPASRLIASGRTFAEVGSGVNTGIALANPGDQAATVSFYFTDSTGRNFGDGVLTIPARRQMAAFLNEAPFNGGSSLFGTFSFTSSTSIGATALRGFTNERSEFLITTLPVVEIGTVPNASTIAHFADGGGWTTQVVLINPTEAVTTGTVEFIDPAGIVVQTTPYSLQPRSSVRIATAGSGQGIQTGSVRISSPVAAVSIFSFKSNGVTVTQAGVPMTPTATAFRAYVENGPRIRSGIAIANPSGSAVDVTIEFAGVPKTLSIPSRGQTALFLDEMVTLPDLSAAFRTMLWITSPVPIAVTGLRSRTNERGEFLITTTTPMDETVPPSPTELFFPHFAEGGGYSMQFILFGRASSGAMYLLDQAGNPVSLLFR